MSFLRGRVFLLFVLVLLTAGSQVQTLPPKIVVVVKSRALAPYNQAVEGLRRTLLARRASVQVREMELPAESGKEALFFQFLEQMQPELIVTIGTQATLSVMRHVQKVPVVFSLVLMTGDLEHLLHARPLNVTGAAMDIPISLQFERLKEIIPDLKRIGVIFNPANSGAAVEEARRAAQISHLKLIEISVTSEAQVLEELQALKGKVDALWSVADSTVFTPRSVDSILLLTLRDRIPFVGLSPSFVKAGALVSFSCDYEDVGAQSAERVLEILGGKSPAELNVAFPRRVSLFFNLRTARAIHLEISRKMQSESRVEFRR